MNDDFKRTVAVPYQNEKGDEVRIKLSKVACNLIDDKYGKGQRTRVVQEIFDTNVEKWKAVLGIDPSKSSIYQRKQIHDRIVATILGLALED